MRYTHGLARRRLKWVLQTGLLVDIIIISLLLMAVVGQFCWLSLSKKSLTASAWQMLRWSVMSVPSAVLPLSSVVVVVALLRYLHRLRLQSACLAMQALGMGRFCLARLLWPPLLGFILLAVWTDAYWAPQLKRQVAFETRIPQSVGLHGDDSGYWLQWSDGMIHIRSLWDHKHWSGVRYMQNPHIPGAWMLLADDVWYSHGQWLALHPKIVPMDEAPSLQDHSWLNQSSVERGQKSTLLQQFPPLHPKNSEWSESAVVLPIALKPKVLAWAKTKANQLDMRQLLYMLRYGQHWGLASLGSWLGLALRLSMPLSAMLACWAALTWLGPMACPRSRAAVKPTVVLIGLVMADCVIRLMAESWVINDVFSVFLIIQLLLLPWIVLIYSKR